MDQTLLKNLLTAVTNKQAICHLSAHLGRQDKNCHKHVEDFQDEILNFLQDKYGDQYWAKEHKVPGQIVKDSIDILGDLKGRKCIIEIDTLRHDQLSPKFVSRVALCGLEKPIDYVAILYRSTQKSGRNNSEKFIRYMYSILKAINKDSTLIGIFVDETTRTAEVWDCEKTMYKVNGILCKDMNACAKEAVKQFIDAHNKLSYDKIYKIFEQGRSSYISDHRGASRYNDINKKTIDNKPIFVYSQFRLKGSQSNWYRFVELCAKLKINIESVWKQPA